MVRRPLRGALLASMDAELVQGDLESPESLERAVQGVDTVIHLGARAVFEEYSLVRPTIVDGTVSLMQASKNAGVKTFVFGSSLLVYASQKTPIDGRTPAEPRSGYGRAKLEAEKVLVPMAEQAGINLAVIRLPHVYGARDIMFEQVKSGRVFFPGSGNNLYAQLHVEDAARILVRAAEMGWRGTSPVADHLSVSWNDFFDVIAKFYPRFRRHGIPTWMATLGTRAYTPIRRTRRMPSVYTPDAVHGWNLHLPVESGLLWDELGLEPKYPTINEGIPAALDECVSFQWIHSLGDHKA